MSTITVPIPGLVDPLVLDEKCWCCEGTGKPAKGNEGWQTDNGECELCLGSGYKLTQAGLSLLAFSARYRDRISTP